MKIASRARLNSASRQADELLRLAAVALLASDPVAAYGLADRYSRTGHRQSSHAHLLRAEALMRLQMPQLAHRALKAATQADPDDRLAHSRLLQSSIEAERSTAARALARAPDPRQIQLQALNLLPQDIKAVGSARRIGNRIEGWAAWRQSRGVGMVFRSGAGPDFEVALSGKADNVSLHAGDTSASPKSDMRWAHFAIRSPDNITGQLWHGTSDQLGSLRLQSEPCVVPSCSGQDRQLPIFEPPAPRISRVGPSATAAAPNRVSIIVPVYRDVSATRKCLDCVGALESNDFRLDVVIVDDASPEPGIAALLADYRYRVITNSTNLGFAGSVNRALAEIGDGDVLFLNADAYLGPTSIERLRRAAYSAHDIGTVTPLSNNGETTSLPVMFMANAVPEPTDVELINSTIAHALAGTVADIPTGIGFCLYVRRDCLDLVGSLGEEYVRGYGEDADICLRAREERYRSVAALDVYVPHEGSRSFQDEKRSLVVKNIRLLDSRFPTHRSEVNAFRLADPLRSARLEMALATSGALRLVVTSGCLIAQAMDYALSATSTDRATLLLQCDGESHTLWLVDEKSPQRLATGSRVRDALSRFDKTEVALCDPMLAATVRDLTGVCHWDLLVYGRAAGGASAIESERALWAEAIAGTRRVIAATSEAHLFCTDHLGIEPSAGTSAPDAIVEAGRRAAGKTPCVAIVPLFPNVVEPGLITTIAKSLSDDGKDQSARVVVLGATPWDNALLASGLVHVTGPVERESLPDILLPFDFSCAWAVGDRPHFGHPVQQAIRRMGVPLACASWRRLGPSLSTSAELELDPVTPPALQATHVVNWMRKFVGTRSGRREA